MKMLPIGISTFSEIVTENYCYVDKTKYVRQLMDGGKYYFLSRPRRFGKSLFLDTLKCAFEGEKELFKGLYLENNWEWNDKYPVISISFGRGVLNGKEELNQRINAILKDQAEKHAIKYNHELIADRFAELIQRLHEKYGKKIVILVDEYDKPILDHIENIPKAEEMRDGLKNFYSVIKESDSHIRLCFITGVSKFSKVTIFSGLNNLKDISLDPRTGSICGYTESELVTTFESMLEGMDINRVRGWYNGYNFLGTETVYNPYDILLFLDRGEFGNYWFESAIPGFLIKLLKQKRFYIPQLEDVDVNKFVISSFSMEQMTTETILFQSGYLTIKKAMKFGPRDVFRLGFPNQEVKLSFTDALLNGYTPDTLNTAGFQNDMYRALEARDMDVVKATLERLFSSIPFEWYTAGNLDKYEGYYASVVYSFFASLGFDITPEQSSSHGRADIVLKTEERVYVLEFKVVEIVGDGEKAIKQIREKGYHHQYVKEGRDVVLVGIDFSKKERNIVGFAFEMG